MREFSSAETNDRCAQAAFQSLVEKKSFWTIRHTCIIFMLPLKRKNDGRKPPHRHEANFAAFLKPFEKKKGCNLNLRAVIIQLLLKHLSNSLK